jgi:hypothetical protein
MKSKSGKCLVAGICLVALAAPIFAHHSVSAEFDVNQPIRFEGVVKRVDWMNPHIYTLVDVTGDDGRVVTYRVEGNAPNSLFRRGWRKDTLSVGQHVTVEGLCAKNPESTNVGQATITSEDGIDVFSGRASE